MSQIHRRTLLTVASALLAAALIFSHDARAQQAGRVYRVGVLFNGGSDTIGPHRDAIRERLARQGFVEGSNLQTTWRVGGEDRRKDRGIAEEFVAAQSDAILTFSTELTQVAQWATKSIPIVFTHVSDPIADGVVRDYARPGGNTTGVSTRHRELLGKRFELLRELLPRAKRVALVTPYATDPSYAASQSFLRDTATRFYFELIEIPIRRAFEIEEKRAEAIIIYSVLGQRLTMEYLIGLAAKLRIASIFPDAEAVALGGLVSYGTDPLEDTRLSADQLVRVLKGAKPGELPIDQNSRFVLAINMKSARALGVTIPPAVFVRADRVIE